MSNTIAPVPIWLTNRDLLSPVKAAVDRLQQADNAGPITIVDCGSNYPPLLEWYETECLAKVIRESNLGHFAPWEFIPIGGDGYYFVSDSDMDFGDVPLDFLAVLVRGLDRNPDRIKAGLSLRIDDVPADAILADAVKHTESQFWTERLDAEFYAADVDTTPALYRSREPIVNHYGPALRSAPPYTCRHLSWYLTPNNVTDEWRHYLSRIEGEQHLFWSPQLKTAVLENSGNVGGA